MKNKKLSVIIPIYNVEKYVEECLKSVIDQLTDEVEIICIEDASTDRSYDVASDFVGDRDGIKILRNTDNRGLSYSRNRGVEEAEGDFIWFVDSDDTIADHSISRILQLTDHADEEIIYFNKDVIYDEDLSDTSRHTFGCVKQTCHDVDGRKVFCSFVEEQYMPNAYTQVLRRDFLVSEGLSFYEDIVHEDMLFFPISILKAEHVSSVPDVLYHYRRRDGSITSNITIERKHSMFVIVEELLEFWKNNHLEDETSNAMAAYIIRAYRIFENYDSGIPDDNGLIYGTPADALKYEMVTHGRSLLRKGIDLSDRKLNIIRGGDGVWIYGAGAYALDFAKYCINHMITIKGIVVSGNTVSGKKLMNIPVLGFDDNVHADDLYVIAVSEKYYDEIYNSRIDHGCSNVISLAHAD